jgi:hypothetical protein
MAQGVKITHVYLDDTRQGVVRCLFCGVKRPMKLEKSADHIGGKTFKVKCGTCKRVFDVRFELRCHERINTQLPGKLFHPGARDAFETITVTSLSAGGVGFVLQHPRPCQIGERYEVRFVLPDTQRTLVMEDIVITRLEGTLVGAAFSPPDTYNHDLDFYLVPELVALERA